MPSALTSVALASDSGYEPPGVHSRMTQEYMPTHISPDGTCGLAGSQSETNSAGRPFRQNDGTNEAESKTSF